MPGQSKMARAADEAGTTPDNFYPKTAELGLAHGDLGKSSSELK
jgi:hypothetical protein